MINISIINPGGIDNYGERAIMLGTIKEVRQRYPNANIVIFGYEEIGEKDAPLMKQFNDNAIEIMPQLIVGDKLHLKIMCVLKILFFPETAIPVASLEHLKISDIIYAKGQESFVTTYGFKHFVDSFLEPFLVSYINTNVVLYGHSIGPVKGRLNRLIAKHVLRRFKQVQVRDSDSEKYLLTLGYKHEIILRDDLAYSAIKDYKFHKQKNNAYYIVVPNASILLNNAERVAYIRVLSNLVARLSKKSKVVLASSVTAGGWNDDYSICLEIKKEIDTVSIEHFNSLDSLLAEIRYARAVVSSRLHPLILATGLKTPILALSKATKVKGLLKDRNMQDRISNPFTNVSEKLLRKIQ